MSFTSAEFQDLLRLLEQHPEWREELRRVLLTEELLSLPQLVRDLCKSTEALVEAQRRTEERMTRLEEAITALAEAQRRTAEHVAQLEQRVTRLEEAITALAEAQRRTEERVAQLEERVTRLEEIVAALAEAQRQLAEAQRRTEERVAQLEERVTRLEEIVAALAEAQRQLAEAQRRTEERVARLEEAVTTLSAEVAALARAQQHAEQQIAILAASVDSLTRRMDAMSRDVARLKGFHLQQQYERHAPAYFRALARKIRVLSSEELSTFLEEAVEQGRLTDAEADEIIRADIVVRGRHPEEGSDIYLVIEVSWGIGLSDVERAARRALLLSQLGMRTIPVVAGESITEEAARLAQRLNVWRVIDGQMIPPTETFPTSGAQGETASPS
jgi:chromosome segregation ATPase